MLADRVRASASDTEGSYLAQRWDSVGATTFNFTSVSFGPAHPRRVIAVMVSNLSGRTITSASIGGVSATISTSAAASDQVVALIYAVVPTGTSGTISVTFNMSAGACGIGVWRIIPGLKLTPNTASNTDTDSTVAQSIAVKAGGFLIAASKSSNAGSYSWTNATERYDSNRQSGADHTCVATQSRTITATFSVSADLPLVLAHWR